MKIRESGYHEVIENSLSEIQRESQRHVALHPESLDLTPDWHIVNLKRCKVYGAIVNLDKLWIKKNRKNEIGLK